MHSPTRGAARAPSGCPKPWQVGSRTARAAYREPRWPHGWRPSTPQDQPSGFQLSRQPCSARAPFPKRPAELSEAWASAAPAEYPKLVWTYTPFVNPQWGLGALPRGSQSCPRGLSRGQRLRTLLEVRGRPGDHGQPRYLAQGLSGGGRVARSRSQARGQTPAEQEEPGTSPSL